jgi:hypothetical protein
VDGQTLAARTGQNWKLYSGLCLFKLGAVAVFVAAFAFGIASSDLSVLMWLGGFALAIMGSLILTIGIRCPQCHCPFIWKGIRSFPLELWLDQGLWMTHCPKCGFGKDGSPTVSDIRARIPKA